MKAKLKSIWQTITGQHWGPTSVASVAVTAVGVIAGAAVVIFDPSQLSFKTYMQDLGILAGGNGIVAIGRGLHLGQLARQLGVGPTLTTAIGAMQALEPALGSGTVAAKDVATTVTDAEEILNPPGQPSPTPAATSPGAVVGTAETASTPAPAAS